MSTVRNIGFIGFGNMAQAMAEGLIGADAVRPDQICACAKHWEKLKANTEAKGFRPLPTAEDVAREADLVVLAVKPYLIEEVTAPIWNILKEKIVVSVAAGWNFSKYEAIMPVGTRLICTIPNTPVSVGEGIIVCENCHSLTEEDYQAFEELFSSIAVIQPVETSQLSVAGTLSGCGPAFASMFIEALADGAEARTSPGGGLPPCQPDDRRHRETPASDGNPSRRHEGRRLLPRRNHHCGCLRAGGKGLPGSGDRCY